MSKVCLSQVPAEAWAPTGHNPDAVKKAVGEVDNLLILGSF
jgi:hypothetical protein